jgi:hypothetical protein
LFLQIPVNRPQFVIETGGIGIAGSPNFGLGRNSFASPKMFTAKAPAGEGFTAQINWTVSETSGRPWEKSSRNLK